MIALRKVLILICFRWLMLDLTGSVICALRYSLADLRRLDMQGVRSMDSVEKLRVSEMLRKQPKILRVGVLLNATCTW